MTKEADLLSPPPRGSIRRSSVATGDIAKIVSYHSATFSSAVRGDHYNHYKVMAVQKGCHHAFCNPAAVKTHTRLTSALSFKMSARADPCSFTVSFLLSLSWHWHILENGSHTFWSFGNHLLYKLRQNYKSKNTNGVKTKIPCSLPEIVFSGNIDTNSNGSNQGWHSLRMDPIHLSFLLPQRLIK